MPWLLLLIFRFPILPWQDVSLSLTIKHVKQGKGSVYASIWANAETFFKEPMVSEVPKADHDSLQFVFRFKPGIYAISAFQDIMKIRNWTRAYSEFQRNPWPSVTISDQGFLPRNSGIVPSGWMGI